MSALPVARALLIAACALPLAAAAARADCRTAVMAARDAIGQRDSAAITGTVEAVLASPDCPGATKDATRRAGAAALIAVVNGERATGRPIQELEPEIRAAQSHGSLVWQVQHVVAELEWAKGDRTAAAVAYDAALALALADTRAGRGPGPDQLAQIKLRAEEARALAPAVVASGVDLRDLTVVGAAVPPVSVEPITFETATARFDGPGMAYAGDLAARLSRQTVPAVRLVGHTDERGDDSYNMDLSIRRAQALAEFLAAQGYRGAISIEGRGERDPRTLSLGSSYPQEEVWRLNRRVVVVLESAG